MKKIDTRKIQILKYIVEEYIRTGDITGSKSLLQRYPLAVSPATVRSDMSSLEKMGLIFSPYNSSGRLPTTRGIRVFVDYLMNEMPVTFLEAEQAVADIERERAIDDHLYILASRLTRTTHEVSFACMPSRGAHYYLGLSQMIERHAESFGQEVCRIIKILEDRYHFVDLLHELDVGRDRVSVFIGEENLIPDLESCALIVKQIELEGEIGYIGLLGPLKMDYAFNIAALRHIL